MKDVSRWLTVITAASGLSQVLMRFFVTRTFSKSGGVAKGLRRRSAKPLFGGSSPPAASTFSEGTGAIATPVPFSLRIRQRGT